MAVETEYKHIALNKQGTPVIEGTSIKVIELVVERLAYGWSPEELHFQHPALTLGQIHAALAYYWDHAQELDREIEMRLKKVERLRRRQAKSQTSPWVAKLRAARLR
ncbi:DUF433 domain-containing protein [Candidatus Acetothermia bacterium]|nr:DUF433 domain-containing protein [Candidatus Acetothermia bacterium]